MLSRSARPLALALGSTLCCSPPAGAAPVGVGDVRVEVNELGVLTRVPARGVRTVDGPPATLAPGFAEWFGVSFRTGADVTMAGGSGVTPDWANRSAVAAGTLTTIDGRVTAVATAGDLEITTELWPDVSGAYLVVQVTLTNRSAIMMRDIFYTREMRAAARTPGWTFPTDYTPALPAAPPDVMRRAWMLDDLPPGQSAALGFTYTAAERATPATDGVDVPLTLWTDASFPSGLDFGQTRGISYGDYDADGFIDVFALMSAHLWRNVNGETWQLVADLDSVLPFANNRYGSAFGDYNNDGLPDIGTEGRKEVAGGADINMHLLKNLGGTTFVDVATDPAIIDEQGWGDQESICWGDVDGDADLDMFLPVYPPWAFANPGNFFYRNLGPVGAGGTYVFQEFSAEAQLDNPSTPFLTARPEGAQFVDVDFDGDLDLYSNGTLYQNNSTPGLPAFTPLLPGSGIGFATALEEGAAFADYDLDGDYDLLIVYTSTSLGVRIWENRGDGAFFGVESGVVQSPFIGLNLGLSTEDWDNDGDMDLTTRQVFRRNMLMETGTRSFVVATHAIPGSHITSATPAWGDWDKDGDLDSALGNWLSTGHFYENTLYDADTPAADRRYLRVRALRDSADVQAGLETEYGTSVEIDIAGDDGGHRRKKFTASSGGYLNQNEYTLHFGMPAAPEGGDEVTFDVIADFPNLPSEGMWRVDKHVNPVLGDVDLGTLTDREIVVFRSGTVVMNGATHAPSATEGPLLTTAGGGLVQPNPDAFLPAPDAAPGADHFVGIDFDTIGAGRRVRVREIMLDGSLAGAVDCDDEIGTLRLWDVTTPAAPTRVPGGALDLASSPRNHRTSVHTSWLLDVDRRYRLVAHVDTLRATNVAGPIVHGDLRVNGGLSFPDAAPCTGVNVAAAAADPGSLYLTFRFGAVLGDPCPWDFDASGDVGFADLLSLLAAWGPCAGCPQDVDGDEEVGFGDLLTILSAWGPCGS